MKFVEIVETSVRQNLETYKNILTWYNMVYRVHYWGRSIV